MQEVGQRRERLPRVGVRGELSILLDAFRTITVVVLMLSAIGLAACGRQGSGAAEAAGKSVDSGSANSE